jgi:RimJ/RimL family protein N-acetyltransferase
MAGWGINKEYLYGRSMAKLIEFETERLRLRQWLPSDRVPFAALNADPKVTAFFPSGLDRAASDALADRFESLIAERGWGFWATELKENSQFIGFVGLHALAPELPFFPGVEIGWRLAYRYWGKGYATEAARGCLRVGFEQLGLDEIVSFTTLRNTRSRAVMERLGMKEDIQFEHPKIPVGHPIRPHCLYRLARERWLHNNAP